MTKHEEMKLRKAIKVLDDMYAEKSFSIEYIRYFLRKTLSTSNDDELEDFLKTEWENQDTPFLNDPYTSEKECDLLTTLSNIQSLLDELKSIR